MKIQYKTLFALISLLGITTTTWAYICCPNDTVVLCGDKCCKTKCTKNGKCCTGDECCEDTDKPGTGCNYECQKDGDSYKWVKTNSTCCEDDTECTRTSQICDLTQHICKETTCREEDKPKIDAICYSCQDSNGSHSWKWISGCCTSNSQCADFNTNSEACNSCDTSTNRCVSTYTYYDLACCESRGKLFDEVSGGCYDPSVYKKCSDGSVVYKTTCCDSDSERSVKDVEYGMECYRHCNGNGVWEFDSDYYKMVDGKCYIKEYCFSDSDCAEFTAVDGSSGSCGYCDETHRCNAIPAGHRKLDPDFSCCKYLGGSIYHCGDNQWCCLPGDSGCVRENC